MATVNKNFRIKDGLIVEGTTGTINGYDIFTAANTTDDVAEGTTNLFFTAQRAQDAVSGEIGTMIGDALALLTTSDIEEGTNLYFTEQRVRDAIGDYQRPIGPGTGINVGTWFGPTGPAEVSINRSVVDTWYDAAGAASTAEGNANDYTDSAISAAASNYDPAGSAQGAYENALADANSYTDTAISTAVSGLAPNYVTAVDTNVFNVDSGTLQLNSVVSAPGTEVHITKLELHTSDDTNHGVVMAHPSDGSLTVAAINDLNLEAHNGNINLSADANVVLYSNLTTNGASNITAGNNLYAGSGTFIGGSDWGNDGFLEVKDSSGTTNVYIGANTSGASLEIHGTQTLYTSINDGGTQYGNIGYDGGANLVINGSNNDVILTSDSGYAYIGTNGSPATRIATQAYVDGLVQGLNVKDSVRVASTTYVDPLTTVVAIDGITLANGDRVLLKNQSPDRGNGVYVFDLATTTLSRAEDQLTPVEGDYVLVTEGTYAATGWLVTHVGSGVIWSQFSAANEYTASTGITITGNAISVTANTYDAYGAASTAESNAKSYADTNFVNIADLPGQLSDYVLLAEKGQALGVATLDADGQVPAEQLGNVPANYITSVGSNLSVSTGELNLSRDVYVDDINLGSNNSGFPSTKIYGYETFLSPTLSTTEIFSFDAAQFTVAELFVKYSNTAQDVEVSKLLIAVDGSNNVAVTEYGIVATNTTTSSISVVATGTVISVKITATGGTTTVGATLLGL
jgi:hypothetical protein